MPLKFKWWLKRRSYDAETAEFEAKRDDVVRWMDNNAVARDAKVIEGDHWRDQVRSTCISLPN